MAGVRVGAEAKLEIHDANTAWRLFSESFGELIASTPGAIYKVMHVACHPEELAKHPQGVSALTIVKASQLMIPGQNGQGRKR